MRGVNKSPVSGFTLVELLVSIVIIALLLTIAVPSLQRAMALAQQSNCMGNLRFQTQAHALYGSNNHFNKPPIMWKMFNSFGYFPVTPNVKMNGETIGQGILVHKKYLPLRTLLCPSSSMIEDSLMDQDAWLKKSVSGSSYSYFWRHSDSFAKKADLLSGYKYSEAEAKGRYGLSMDFNAMSGHSYMGAFGSADWPSHPVLGYVNIAYSDGSVSAEDNTKIILKPPFNIEAKMTWWDLAHKARRRK